MKTYNNYPLKKINKNKGFSLIELMIAVLIGIIMLAAIVNLFTNFSGMNRAQSGLARVQENGRFIALIMRKDLENVGSQPCASISMDSPLLINKGFATKPYVNYTALTNGMPNSKIIDTQYLIQGHECDDLGACSPLTNITPGGDPYNKVPAAGNSAGDRAFLTDVLTVRYLSSEGVDIDSSTTSSLKLFQDASSPPLSLDSGDDVLVTNCTLSMIVPASVSGTTINIGGGANVDWTGGGGLSYVYNFTKDFLTVSYYVGLKENPDDNTKVISSLYRVENGSAPQELVEGVERLDFTYGVAFQDGKVAYLTADQVQSTAAANCIVSPLVPSSLGLGASVNGAGCLWRSVFAIKVNVLLNTVYNSAPTATETYTYSPDGALANPQTPTSIPSGADPGRMYRKEFSTTITLNSNNL